MLDLIFGICANALFFKNFMTLPEIEQHPGGDRDDEFIRQIHSQALRLRSSVGSITDRGRRNRPASAWHSEKA